MFGTKTPNQIGFQLISNITRITRIHKTREILCDLTEFLFDCGGNGNGCLSKWKKTRENKISPYLCPFGPRLQNEEGMT